MKRIFIVGLARSGTTLLQSMLANDEDIFTFPESHLFRATLPKQYWLRPFKRMGEKEINHVRSFLKSNQAEHLFEPYSGSAINTKAWARYLIQSIDALAEENKKSCWIEKTPMHLHFTKLILREYPETKFIQLVRNPIENIAALYQVGKDHSDHFQAVSLKKAIKRYKDETNIMLKNTKYSSVKTIYYEDLVLDTDKTLNVICTHLEVEYKPEMLNHVAKVDQIKTQEEAWKQGNTSALSLKEKAKKRLSPEAFDYLEKEVRKIKNPLITRYINA